MRDERHRPILRDERRQQVMRDERRRPVLRDERRRMVVLVLFFCYRWKGVGLEIKQYKRLHYEGSVQQYGQSVRGVFHIFHCTLEVHQWIHLEKNLKYMFFISGLELPSVTQ